MHQKNCNANIVFFFITFSDNLSISTPHVLTQQSKSSLYLEWKSRVFFFNFKGMGINHSPYNSFCSQMNINIDVQKTQRSRPSSHAIAKLHLKFYPIVLVRQLLYDRNWQSQKTISKIKIAPLLAQTSYAAFLYCVGKNFHT